jgi:hypothetical protein
VVPGQGAGCHALELRHVRQRRDQQALWVVPPFPRVIDLRAGHRRFDEVQAGRKLHRIDRRRVDEFRRGIEMHQIERTAFGHADDDGIAPAMAT